MTNSRFQATIEQGTNKLDPGYEHERWFLRYTDPEMKVIFNLQHTRVYCSAMVLKKQN